MAHATWGRSLADAAEALVPTRRAGDDAVPQKTAGRPPRRQLAYDGASQREGEIMPDVVPARLRDPNAQRSVRLRPVGGGYEWTADPDDITLLPPFLFSVDDVVRVRGEEALLWVIDQPTDGPPTCDPDQLPPVGALCCVPLAVLRPYDNPDGERRWVEQADLLHAEAGA